MTGRGRKLEDTNNETTKIDAPAHINIRSSSQPANEPCLPAIDPKYKYTLVLDLDETLVHFD